MSINIQQMMQQAQQMQEKLKSMQERIGNMVVEGTSGGGSVAVQMTCKGTLESIKIADSLIAPDEKEMLEDLIVAACNDARSKADQTMTAETQNMMEEMGLPSNMQLPF